MLRRRGGDEGDLVVEEAAMLCRCVWQRVVDGIWKSFRPCTRLGDPEVGVCCGRYRLAAACRNGGVLAGF